MGLRASAGWVGLRLGSGGNARRVSGAVHYYLLGSRARLRHAPYTTIATCQLLYHGITNERARRLSWALERRGASLAAVVVNAGIVVVVVVVVSVVVIVVIAIVEDLRIVRGTRSGSSAAASGTEFIRGAGETPAMRVAGGRSLGRVAVSPSRASFGNTNRLLARWPLARSSSARWPTLVLRILAGLFSNHVR